MARGTLTAADYVDKHAIEVAVILAELAESAGSVGRSWALAVASARRNPENALQLPVEADIRLNIMVRNELKDSRRVIRTASNKLDRELPDEDEESSLPEPVEPA